MPAQLTHAQYQTFLKRYFPTVRVLEPYTGSLAKLNHKCTAHGIEFRTSYNNLHIQAKKGRGSTCPACSAARPPAPAKNGHITTLVSQDEAQARLNNRFGPLAPKIVGEYTGVSKKQRLECRQCGHQFSASISHLTTQYAHPCTCSRAKAMIPFASLSKKELDFLKFLYLELSWTASQISETTGIKVGTVIAALKEIGCYRSRNKTQSVRNSAERKSSAYVLDSKAYRVYARLLTNYVYSAYQEVLDPMGVRGLTHHLDHILSLHDGYHKYGSPIPLSIVCHPANLRVIGAHQNLSKNRKSRYTLRTLKSKIGVFEKKHGPIVFPEHLQLDFSRTTTRDNTSGLRVLAFDPGTSNFGVFGGTLYGAKTLQGASAKISRMLKNTVRSMGEDFTEQLRAYMEEMRELIASVRPHVVVIERFQSRGLKGTTVELVNVMIGALGALLYEIEAEHGVHIAIKTVMASQWKNALNRCFDIEELYTRMPASQRHRLDACLLSFYAFPDPHVYRSIDPKRRESLVNFILRTRV